MPVSVTMPQLGESVSEGTVTRWLKKEGEHVDTDEPLLEVSTEKVDTEIPSPASGTLQTISVSEDETVEVGTEIGLIAEDGDSAAASDGAAQAPAQEQPTSAQEPAAPEQPEPAAAAQESPAPAQNSQAPAQEAAVSESAPASQEAPSAQQQAPAQQPSGQDAALTPSAAEQAPPVAEQAQPDQDAPAAESDAPAPPAQQESTAATPYVTPLVRKLAAEHGVDLSSVEGTGVGGRIRKQDVLDAARSRQAQQPAAAATPAAEAPQRAAASQAPSPAAPSAEAQQLRGRTEKVSRMRAVIAQRMKESLDVSAQLTTVIEVDVTQIARLRERSKADFEAREGVKLSFLPFFVQATVEALKTHPKLNASIDTDKGEITYFDAEHLGIAVDTERGLIVPVIRDAGDLNLGGLARKIADLADRTRAAKVSPDELAGGTFTVTNIGSRGVLTDTPIINQPQVGILGTGKVVKRPVVVDDPELGEVFAARSTLHLSLTYDHRLVDGADAARFVTTIKDRLEEGNFEGDLGLT